MSIELKSTLRAAYCFSTHPCGVRKSADVLRAGSSAIGGPAKKSDPPRAPVIRARGKKRGRSLCQRRPKSREETPKEGNSGAWLTLSVRNMAPHCTSVNRMRGPRNRRGPPRQRFRQVSASGAFAGRISGKPRYSRVCNYLVYRDVGLRLQALGLTRGSCRRIAHDSHAVCGAVWVPASAFGRTRMRERRRGARPFLWSAIACRSRVPGNGLIPKVLEQDPLVVRCRFLMSLGHMRNLLLFRRLV